MRGSALHGVAALLSSMRRGTRATLTQPADLANSHRDSLPHLRAPPHLVEEVHQKGHVVLRLLLLRRLGWHERGDAFAVRRQVVGPNPEPTEVRQPLLGPQPSLVYQERISANSVAGHHN